MINAIPDQILNFVGNQDCPASTGSFFPKHAPASGRVLCHVARSGSADIDRAIEHAKGAQPSWAEATVVHRGDLLRRIAIAMDEHRDDLARVVASETGKSLKDARGETAAAIEMGYFIAGEGRRFYGRTTTSAVPNKTAITVRQPIGVAGLIIAANTPIANVAWKVFPALLCGNAAILKPAEDTPVSAWAFAQLARSAGLPAGVLAVIHGFGEEAGAPLVESRDVGVVSFTGSTDVGRYIARVAGERLAKVCLELGGKNPLIVCDDADLDAAVHAATLSAFSNAGQRCAAGSRILVFDAVYEEFRDRLVQRARALRVGPADDDDFGPVINEAQLQNMLMSVARARDAGAKILVGGERLAGAPFGDGYYMAPTLIENVRHEDEISRTELFGPISTLYRVRDFSEAISIANDSPYGLTAALHTRNLDRAMSFLSRIQCGVAVVNGGTYGSEPHMPFGGLRQSGNGFREAGTEVLDVYSDWKTIYVNYSPASA